MTKKEGLAYSRGGRAAWLHLLNLALRHLGDEAPPAARAASERAEAIVVLRDLCGDFGDNDWPDDLHLADIIDKHLGRHLHEADE